MPKDAWVMYDSCEDEDLRSGQSYGQQQAYIGMIKLRGAWRLCHAYHYVDYSGADEALNSVPLVDISIEGRIKAAEHIEKLREEIVKEKEKLVPEI